MTGSPGSDRIPGSAFRKARGELTVPEIARIAEVSERTWHRYERGASRTAAFAVVGAFLTKHHHDRSRPLEAALHNRDQLDAIDELEDRQKGGGS